MQYGPEDGGREAGFALYYLGINLGALVGPLLTGLLQTNLGFRAGFGLAAVGMALGLAQDAWPQAADGARAAGAQPAAGPWSPAGRRPGRGGPRRPRQHRLHPSTGRGSWREDLDRGSYE